VHALELRVVPGAVPVVAPILVLEEGVAELEQAREVAIPVVVLIDVGLEELDVLAVLALLGGLEELLEALAVGQDERVRHHGRQRVARGRRAVRPGNGAVRRRARSTGRLPATRHEREGPGRAA